MMRAFDAPMCQEWYCPSLEGQVETQRTRLEQAKVGVSPADAIESVESKFGLVVWLVGMRD